MASAIDGVERFLTRAWRIVTGPDVDEAAPADRFIADISDAIEKMHFNVAIARLMEFAPSARSKASKDILVRLLAPLAPHLAEELWHQLGHERSVHETSWPGVDPAALLTPTVALVVQVDGRVRAVLTAPRGLAEEESTGA